MRFTVVSYNVLADSYIKVDRYPNTAPEHLDRTWRRPQVLGRVNQLNADVICLQEVEPEAFANFEGHLQKHGYEGHFAQKQGGRPDGSATFVREKLFTVRTGFTLNFQDSRGDEPVSGHLALIVVLECEIGLLGVVNTHLRWDPPGTPRDAQWGYAQAEEIVRHQKVVGTSCEAWILCGDFNARPDSDVTRLLLGSGFQDAYARVQDGWTCNPNGETKRIDFLLHTSGLQAEPLLLPEITGETPLPSADEPSDHLPIAATFETVSSSTDTEE